MAVFQILKIVILLYISSNVQSSEDDIEGYYWRDYKETIPKDAFEAAYTNDNKPSLYVGQVLDRDELIPARIDPFAQQVFFEWGFKEHVSRDDQDVKILCTRHSEQLQWISTGNGSIQNVHNKIRGGGAPNTIIYIGRKVVDGEYTIGKVNINTNKKQQATLHTSKNGNGYVYWEFEILTYNPNIKKVVHSPTISKPVQPASCVTKQIIINYYTKS